MLHRPLAFVLLIAWCSCANRHQVEVPPADPPATDQDPTALFHTGRVTTAFAAEGCPLLVALDREPDVFLIPIGLDERYTRNGTQLRFRYRPSRASNGGCLKGQPAVLEDIIASLQPEKANSPLPDR